MQSISPPTASSWVLQFLYAAANNAGISQEHFATLVTALKPHLLLFQRGHNPFHKLRDSVHVAVCSTRQPAASSCRLLCSLLRNAGQKEVRTRARWLY
jgi:hypothetical protein